MPALSPTMTEGNISSWRLKEGDSFTAGDVILEIETDKATMDVEAQDDGVLFKIMEGDGRKGVKVGQRIAVLAEPGDDLGSLEIPADEAKSSSSASQAEKTQEESASPPKEDTTAGGSKDVSTAASDSDPEISRPYAETPTSTEQRPKQKYPLFPAVQQLLHSNGLSDADAEKITASGPMGRLLKGDVLAHLGKINKDYPSQSSARLEKLSHLDLSNIELATSAPPAKAADAAPPTTAADMEVPMEKELAVPVSLSAVIATQKRVQDTLGIFLPLSTFVARASELANEDLPASKRKPTADDLFNSVLGLDAVSKSSRGSFIPQVSAISPAPPVLPPKTKKPDIIDMLSAPKGRSTEVRPEAIPPALGAAAGDNVVSVTAKAGDEGRATEYLERLKLALEKEPGKLVL